MWPQFLTGEMRHWTWVVAAPCVGPGSPSRVLTGLDSGPGIYFSLENYGGVLQDSNSTGCLLKVGTQVVVPRLSQLTTNFVSWDQLNPSDSKASCLSHGHARSCSRNSFSSSLQVSSRWLAPNSDAATRENADRQQLGMHTVWPLPPHMARASSLHH